ncbi:MAG: hypothetical protein QM632_03825 [Micrococcaceae bacterium]
MNTILATTTQTAVPTETPGEYEKTNPEMSPGFLGFVVTFILALCTMALAYSVSRRIRRLKYRDLPQEQQEQQQQSESQNQQQ